MVEATPDLLRLFAVPVFGAVAVMDVRTRRVPSSVWVPLAVFACVLLGWELFDHFQIGGIVWRLYLLRVLLSVGLLAPLGYLFWRLGAFGGADAKALATLAVLFPTYPHYQVGSTVLPLVETHVGVFSLTILTNAVLVGLAYPLVLGGINAAHGRVHVAMFVGRPVHWSSLEERHGRLLESTAGFTRDGLDLDALRMYLTWRGCDLAELRADPERYRDPSSLPADPNPPGDGRVTDGGKPRPEPATADEAEASNTVDDSDPWGARAFLDDVDGAYGTRPETLRDGLALVAERDRVWISPGIPFLVPLGLGLLVALGYGDLLFRVLAPLLT